MVHSSGKMLIATRSSTVGAMNSQAMARSDTLKEVVPRSRGTGRPSQSVRLDLAVFLEHLLPILHQKIERFLRGALVGHDVVMNSLLHIEQELRIGGLGPEVLDDIHGLQEIGGKRRALRETRIIEHRLVAGITAKR